MACMCVTTPEVNIKDLDVKSSFLCFKILGKK